MSCYVNKVIEIAKAEIGYLEKASNSSLDSKTLNAGRNNFTKYARDLDNIPGFYNGKKNGYPWCDCFVDYCFVKAYGVDDANRLLCQPNKSLGAGCQYSMNYYKTKGQLKTTPKIGDQIFFKSSSGEIVHTGLVYDVDKTYVYTIEGNTSSASGVVANGGGVFAKKYSLNYGRIAGYGRPAYDVKKSEDDNVKSAQKSEEIVKGGTCIVELYTLRKGSKGNSVKALQMLLTGNGYSCGSAGIDGDFGAGTYKAVINFQKNKKIGTDGIVGVQTWSKLLK